MCGYKENFVKLDENVNGKVSFEDTFKVQNLRKRLISLMDCAHKLTINIYYVPKSKSNTLNLGQLVEKECAIHKKDKSMVLDIKTLI